MIATYIQELLATNNRVIVPNYGAFLVRATSKSKDANNLKDKLKDIYFSPFLKFNDELLEKYIIKKEGVTKEQASEKIKQFIEDVKKELDQEKPYSIPNFGQFVADKQGKVQFNTIVNEEKQEETKPETKKATPASKTTAKKTAAKTASAKKTPEPEKTELKTEAKTEIKKEETKKATTLKEFKEEEKKETPKVAPPSTKKEETQKPKATYSYKKEKKTINKGLVWAIAIGVPVAAIFLWGVFNFETVEKIFSKEKAKTEKVAKKTTKSKKATAKKAESSKKTQTAKSTTKQTSKKKTTTTTKKAEPKKAAVKTKKYYIIAGSFKNEKYAISYLNKLKADGFKAEKLEERNGMHAVSYNSFTDKRKAIAEYKFIAQEKGLQAWILYY